MTSPLTDLRPRALHDIVAVSPSMRRAVALADRFAGSGMPMLLVGATGTGKELLARHIHARSHRAGRFVDINCGALPHDLMEGLLFGRARGAYTGAIDHAAGLIEAAGDGTLFLDELCSLSPEGQVKLLRVLETGEVRRVGETDKRAVDLRVVAAVQDDFRAKVAHGVFRIDLLQRVTGVVIELLPLADRPDDLLPIAEFYADAVGRRLGDGVSRVLERYSWPGNVRELRGAVERAAFLTDDSALPGSALAQAIDIGAAHVVPPGGIAPVEPERLRTVCEAHAWHAPSIARALGVSRSTLYRRLREAGLSLAVGRRGPA